MAFGIIIADAHGKAEKSLALYVEDYDFILNRIEGDNNFHLLNRVFEDFYGEGQIFLNELASFREEVLLLREKIRAGCPETTAKFMGSFALLIGYAIKNKKTIQFAGD